MIVQARTHHDLGDACDSWALLLWMYEWTDEQIIYLFTYLFIYDR